MINNMPKNRKKCVFWPKDGPLKADFGKNFKIYKKTYKCIVCENFRSIEPFLAILWHFSPFLAHFPIIRKKWAKMGKMA